MDLIEYANNFIELDLLIKAVYGGTEEGIHGGAWRMLDGYTIYAGILNWNTCGLYIRKPSENSKWYVPGVVEFLGEIGDEKLYFGFWVRNKNEPYLVSGFGLW